MEDASEERESYEVALSAMDGVWQQRNVANGKIVEKSRDQSSKTNANSAEAVKNTKDKSKAKRWRTIAEATAEYDKQKKKCGASYSAR